MSFDAFINFDGIPGESTDDAHSDWIEILQYNHALTQPTAGESVSTGGSRTAARVTHDGFSFTKAMDKTTPKLQLHCCNGKHIPTVHMEICRAGGEKQKFYDVVMEDVIIGSIEVSGGQGAPLPFETLTLYYGKITWTYTEIDHKSGEPKGDVPAFWDLHANKGG